MSLTQARLKEMLEYDPDTGVFTWRAGRFGFPRKKGDIAGAEVRDRGKIRQIHIQIDGEGYSAHRLAWLYVHGHFPLEELDHRDRDPSNNRFTNLRECNFAQNQQNRGKPKNNTSGVKGVSLCPQTGKWAARVSANGKRYRLGRFADIESARLAVVAKRAELHGEFANHG